MNDAERTTGDFWAGAFPRPPRRVAPMEKIRRCTDIGDLSEREMCIADALRERANAELRDHYRVWQRRASYSIDFVRGELWANGKRQGMNEFVAASAEWAKTRGATITDRGLFVGGLGQFRRESGVPVIDGLLHLADLSAEATR